MSLPLAEKKAKSLLSCSFDLVFSHSPLCCCKIRLFLALASPQLAVKYLRKFGLLMIFTSIYIRCFEFIGAYEHRKRKSKLYFLHLRKFLSCLKAQLRLRLALIPAIMHQLQGLTTNTRQATLKLYKS